MKSEKLSAAMLMTLERLDCLPSDGSVWWHDIPAGTREALWRLGLLFEPNGRTPCNTHTYAHPGYVSITDAGRRALEGEQEIRLARVRSHASRVAEAASLIAKARILCDGCGTGIKSDLTMLMRALDRIAKKEASAA